MSKDKCPSIFSRQMCYNPSNIFRNSSGFENWGISLDIIYSFSWGISDHVTSLDQSSASKNFG